MDARRAHTVRGLAAPHVPDAPQSKTAGPNKGIGGKVAGRGRATVNHHCHCHGPAPRPDCDPLLGKSDGTLVANNSEQIVWPPHAH